jgi:hemerythrin
MELIKWKDDFSVNIRIIDAQHKQIVEMINRLHSAMSTGKATEIMDEIFRELITYTNYHFEKEEELMKSYNYPGLSAHKLEHEKLSNQVKQYRDDFKSGRSVVSVDVLIFLKNWLLTHIQKTDKQYSAYLNAKGVS